MQTDSDTIAAIATAPGRGGVSIVRLSGPDAAAIARAIAGELPPPRRAALRRFVAGDDTLLDFGLLLYFAAPRSFTGEDVVELHGHGGTVVAGMLLARCLALGARRAEPGEFSRRAFLNDRLDLTQAEAVADMVASGTERAARAAARSLDGEFSRAVHELSDAVTALRVHVEAAIDFPDDEIDFLSDAALTARLDSVHAGFVTLLGRARRGRVLNDGFKVVILGAPNAGKSSLLNALAGADTAIVTAVPGTTRDVLRELIDINGVPVELIDTAGLRDPTETVEAEGIRRALAVAGSADHALLLVDAAAAADPAGEFAILAAALDSGLAHTAVLNKIDLADPGPGGADDAIRISAKTGAGLDRLRSALREAAGVGETGEHDLSARARHIDALTEAEARFDAGRRLLREQQAGELMAEELKQAQRALGTITGEVSSDDLLGRIFSSFCIGK